MTTTMIRLILVFCCLAALLGNVHGLATTKSRSQGGSGFGASQTAKTYKALPMDDLMQFLRQHKADVDHVQVGQEDDRRGLYTTKKFGKAGAIICKIPSDCALALSDPAKEGKDTPTIAHVGANLLKMYYDYDRNSSQQQAWAKPYLDSLPSTVVDSTPDQWTDEEIDLLEFPSLINLAKERKRNIEQVAREQNIDLEKLKWATWIVSSRSFPISLSNSNSSNDNINADDDTSTTMYDDRGQVITKAGLRPSVRVLVPLLDMVNHDSSVKANAKLTLIDPQKDNAWFALETLRPISVGKEILMSYRAGIASSVDLLLNYGLVLSEPSPIDTYMLQKGGEDSLASPQDWSTTLDEDYSMLSMAQQDNNDETLQRILKFRIRLKESYK